MRIIPFVLLLAGCATTRLVAIDYSRPPAADWPILEERVQRIAPSDLGKFCRSSLEVPDKVASCAVMNFQFGVCYIYLTDDDPDALAHERAHCKGYDHVGSSNLRDGWARIKANRKR